MRLVEIVAQSLGSAEFSAFSFLLGGPLLGIKLYEVQSSTYLVPCLGLWLVVEVWGTHDVAQKGGLCRICSLLHWLELCMLVYINA